MGTATDREPLNCPYTGGCHGMWTSCENQFTTIGAAFFVQGVGSFAEGWTWGVGQVVATFSRLRFVMLAVHIEAAAE